MALLPTSIFKDLPSSKQPLHIAQRKPRVAIVHYWLIGMRGGEKVVEQLCELFPDADIFTHLYDPDRVSGTIRRHHVTETSFSKIPFARRFYRKLVTFMPSALEQLDLSAYDIVFSSESGPAKGVIARPGALHICYVHTPMRYIWDQYTEYQRRSGLLTRFFMPILLHNLRQWDVTSAARVDHFISNSRAVADRVEKYWRRESEVIAPPVDTRRFNPNRPRGDYYLFISELVSYKRADIAILACNALERRLVVIGDGPDAAKLKKLGGKHTEFLGRVPDKVLEDYAAGCQALLFPAEEDFGITPVEAMAAGAPVIAYGRGGARDYVIPGRTGLFMNDQSSAGMIEAIIRFELLAERFKPEEIAKQARTFDTEIFRSRMKTAILQQLEKRSELHWAMLALRAGWTSEASQDEGRPVQRDDPG